MCLSDKLDDRLVIYSSPFSTTTVVYKIDERFSGFSKTLRFSKIIGKL